MEDDDDKVRRNLMLISALILLTAWLEVPISAVFDRTVPIGAEWKVSPWKAWVATYAILFYAALRYRFSSDGNRGISIIKRDYYAGCESRLQRLIQREIDRYNEREIDSSLFSPALKEVDREGRSKARLASDSPERLRLISHVHDMTRRGPWAAEFDVVVVQSAGSTNKVMTKMNLSFRTPQFFRWRYSIESWFCSWIYSEGSVQYLIPMISATMASGIVAHKATSALLGR